MDWSWRGLGAEGIYFCECDMTKEKYLCYFVKIYKEYQA